MQQRFNWNYIDGGKKHTHTLINKYGASRQRGEDLEGSMAEKRDERRDHRPTEGGGSEDGEKKRRMMQMVGGGGSGVEGCHYLWNPPAAPHQRTAYPSATLKSSNRPGTVHGATPEGHVSHTPRRRGTRRRPPDRHCGWTSVMFKPCWWGTEAAATLVAPVFVIFVEKSFSDKNRTAIDRRCWFCHLR